jgi:hypothetical protein
VSFWTPSRQLEFSKWLRDTFGHSPASIERRLDVVCAAFHEMTEVKLRLDPFGQTIETALMTHAPKFVYKRARIAKELKIAPSTPRHTTHSLDDIATVLDALEQEHLFRFSIIALNTWARPEAVSDFNPLTQRRNGLIDLNPPDRVQTNKRRPLIPETRNLRAGYRFGPKQMQRPAPSRWPPGSSQPRLGFSHSTASGCRASKKRWGARR